MSNSTSGGKRLNFVATMNNAPLAAGATQAKGIISGLAAHVKKAGVFMPLLGGAAIGGGIFGKLANDAKKFSGEFGYAMREIKTISASAQKDFEGVSKALIDMGASGADSAIELSKGFYQIVSAGHDGARGMEILEASSKLAVGTLTDVYTAADTLTSIINAYGDEAGTALSISDKLFEVVKNGKTTMSQLGGSIGNVTGLAAQAGLELDQLFAAYSTGTKTLKTEEFTTGMRGLLTAVISGGTEESAQIIKELGLEFDVAAMNAKGLVGFLQDIITKTNGNIEVLQKLFPNIRGLTGFLSLATEGGKEFAKQQENITNSIGNTFKAYSTMMEAGRNQWSMVHNKWDRELKQLGDSLNYASKGSAKFFNSLLTGVEDMEAKAPVIGGLFDRIAALRMMGESMPSAYLTSLITSNQDIQGQIGEIYAEGRSGIQERKDEIAAAKKLGDYQSQLDALKKIKEEVTATRKEMEDNPAEYLEGRIGDRARAVDRVKEMALNEVNLLIDENIMLINKQTEKDKSYQQESLEAVNKRIEGQKRLAAQIQSTNAMPDTETAKITERITKLTEEKALIEETISKLKAEKTPVVNEEVTRLTNEYIALEKAYWNVAKLEDRKLLLPGLEKKREEVETAKAKQPPPDKTDSKELDDQNKKLDNINEQIALETELRRIKALPVNEQQGELDKIKDRIANYNVEKTTIESLLKTIGGDHRFVITTNMDIAKQKITEFQEAMEEATNIEQAVNIGLKILNEQSFIDKFKAEVEKNLKEVSLDQRIEINAKVGINLEDQDEILNKIKARKAEFKKLSEENLAPESKDFTPKEKVDMTARLIAVLMDINKLEVEYSKTTEKIARIEPKITSEKTKQALTAKGLTAEQIKQLEAELATEDAIRRRIEKMLEAAQIAQDTATILGAMSYAIGIVDDKIGKILGSMADLANNTSNLLTAVVSKDYVAAAASAIGMIGNFIQMIKSEDEGDNAIDRLNESLERQNEILSRMNTLDWIKNVGSLVTTINTQVDNVIDKLNSIDIVEMVGKQWQEIDLGNGVMTRWEVPVYAKIDTSEWETNDWLEWYKNYTLNPTQMNLPMGISKADQETLKENGALLESLNYQLDEIAKERTMKITGLDAGSIAEDILKGFEDGLELGESKMVKVGTEMVNGMQFSIFDVVTDIGEFSETFGKMMEQSLKHHLKTVIEEQLLTNFMASFTNFAENGLTPEEINTLKGDFADAVKAAQEMWNSIEPMLPDEVVGPEAEKPLTGVIRGLTEETGSLLVGQFYAMRENLNGIDNTLASQLTLVEESLGYQRETAINTRRLEAIETATKETTRLINERL